MSDKFVKSVRSAVGLILSISLKASFYTGVVLFSFFITRKTIEWLAVIQ